MDEAAWARLLEQAQRLGADYADLRHGSVRRLSVEMQDGEMKRAVPGEEDGIGIRVIVDGAWGFFSTNRLDPQSLQDGIQNAIKTARAARPLVKDPARLAPAKRPTGEAIWTPRRPPEKEPLDKKIDLLGQMYRSVKDRKEILSVTTSYSEATTRQHYLDTEGADVTTQVTRVLAQTHFIAKKEGRVTSRRARIGGTGGFEHFIERSPAEEAEHAAEITLKALTAPAPPAGRMTVVTDPDLTGVFTHEAVGHASEADLVLAGDSCLEGRIGETLAPEWITVVDDSTIDGAFGSFPYDDNGIPGQRKVIIENGVLKAHLTDRHSAAQLDMPPNGAARAEDHTHRPIVRMSNTFLEAGDHSFDELFEGIKTGVYAKGTRGGQVDTAKGGFQFAAQDAYLIENGEIKHPLRDAALSGNILRTLKNIDALGKDWRIGDPGICGKGQLVPVGDGGPTTRIRDIAVGGIA
jgi:TldD protein